MPCRHRSVRHVALWILNFSLLGCFINLFGQGTTGQLSGTLTDSTGASVAAATVRLENKENGQQRTTTTDSSGRFTFTELVPGTFTLSAEASGFKKFEQSGIRVSASERV